RAFPLGREELFAYDVVILGDANPALLGGAALQNLADFVGQPAKGGSLVLIEGFVVRPTDLGLASPAMQLGDTPEETERIWRSLAPLYWLLELPELKPGVRVLAEHPTRTTP